MKQAVCLLCSVVLLSCGTAGTDKAQDSDSTIVLSATETTVPAARLSFVAERLVDSPIITPALDASIGENIQGPSVTRVPDWVPNRLGKYYMYFAHHKGTYIRMAYADNLAGPWKIYKPGALQLSESYFLTKAPKPTPEQMAAFEKMLEGQQKISHDLTKEATTPHIASPDIHIDSANKQFILYYHGLYDVGKQGTRVATSKDGIHFKAMPELIVDLTYLHTFKHDGYVYGMTMPGQFYRSKDGFSGFEKGPRLFNTDMRHPAFLKRGNILYTFWTQVGTAPEGIKVSAIDISGDWNNWKPEEAVEVIRPERPWEGANEPVVPSQRSTAYGRVNQLRDPAIFEENGQVYLLYAVAGESGIGIARLDIR